MELDRLKLAYRDSKTNIWLVRATGGRYLEHFKQAGVVAIEHLDDIYDHRDLVDTSIPSYDEVRKRLLRKPEYTTQVESRRGSAKKLNGTGTKRLNQITSFNEKIKQGDIIVSTDGHALLIGICGADESFFSSSDEPHKSIFEFNSERS